MNRKKSEMLNIQVENQRLLKESNYTVRNQQSKTGKVKALMVENQEIREMVEYYKKKYWERQQEMIKLVKENQVLEERLVVVSGWRFVFIVSDLGYFWKNWSLFLWIFECWERL